MQVEEMSLWTLSMAGIRLAEYGVVGDVGWLFNSIVLVVWFFGILAKAELPEEDA